MAVFPRLKRVPALPELLGLYRGDELSTGYVQEGLIREICRQLKPSDELELLRQLHPGCEPDDVDAYTRKTISLAFRKWTLERPRKGLSLR